MFLKVSGLVAISFFSFSAFAHSENNLATSVESEAKSTFQKGVSVGLEYMNASDQFMRVTFKHYNREETRENRMTEGFGVSGIRVGYTQIPERGLGLNAGVSLLQGLNKSEYIGEREQFLIPQFNVHYAFNSYFTVYWGANISILTAGENKNMFKPDFGGQFGLGARFTRNIALNAGYSLMRFRIDEQLSGGTHATGSFHVGGFNSNLTYTF